MIIVNSFIIINIFIYYNNTINCSKLLDIKNLKSKRLNNNELSFEALSLTPLYEKVVYNGSYNHYPLYFNNTDKTKNCFYTETFPHKVTIKTIDDRKYNMLNNKFEYVKLKNLNENVINAFKDVQKNGVSGDDVGLKSTNVLKDKIIEMFTFKNNKEKTSSDIIMDYLNGWNNYDLNGYIMNYKVGCAGLTTRKSGPNGRLIYNNKNDNFGRSGIILIIIIIVLIF